VTVTGSNGTTIDLIALPGTTSINLNGGTGMIDGVAVMVQAGLPNADADGSTGSVTLVGLSTGGSELTGGDGPTTIAGYGHDTINGGLGAITINTGDGDSLMSLSGSAAASTQDSITSGGGDTIWAGSGAVSVAVIGSTGDTVFAQASQLTFINGIGASTVFAGSGAVLIQAGAGGGVYYAGSGGDSLLAAGTGKVVFYGRASGDVLAAAGAANDILVAAAGSEALTGGGNTGSLTMLGEAGADAMTAGAGHIDCAVGTGNDTITDGGLSDIISILRGRTGGLDVINNFRVGTDELSLTRFNSNAASNAIATPVSDGYRGSLLSCRMARGSIWWTSCMPRARCSPDRRDRFGHDRFGRDRLGCDQSEHQRIECDRQHGPGQDQVLSLGGQQAQLHCQCGQDEGELAYLCQTGSHHASQRRRPTQQAQRGPGDRRLDQHEHRHDGGNVQRLLHQHHRVDQHTDRDEEQDHEDVL
jgi:hypothetical protein